MHPADLATHRANRARQDRRRLAGALRQVALGATTAELVDLERIQRNVSAGAMPVDQAFDHIADLRREQQRAA